MNAYSVMTKLLRPANEVSAAFEVRQPILLSRTAADDLPPYREQPWIIDRAGYRKIDPSMTLVPVSRLLEAGGPNDRPPQPHFAFGGRSYTHQSGRLVSSNMA